MRLYGLDIETYDPFLSDKGVSWVYGEGSIIVTGLYNAASGVKRALAGGGGKPVKNLLQNPDITLAGTNIVYDLGWLCYEHGMKAKDIRCGLIDVSIAEAGIDEYQAYSLDALAMKYLSEQKGSSKLVYIAAQEKLRGDFRRHLKTLWDRGYKQEIREYVISDADQPVRIWEAQKKILEKTGCMNAVTVNLKLIKIVLDMKQRGVRIDLAKRKENAEILRAMAGTILPAFEEKNGQINFNSPKQVAELYTRYNVPFNYRIRVKGWRQKGRKFTKADCFVGDEVWEQRKILKGTFSKIRVEKGALVVYMLRPYAERAKVQIEGMGYEVTCNPTLAKAQMERLRRGYKIVQDVIDLKALLFHLNNFFGVNFERFIVDGRIHPDFNINGARQTDRFSSSNPNGQNIPSKTVLFKDTPGEIKVYKLCRECFIPDKGMLMGKLDFSGQENRLMAHFAVGEKGDFIREKYEEDPDFDEHDLVGKDSGLYEKYGRDTGRKYIKNYRFGKAYGMQIDTMMINFGWDREHAEHMDTVFAECAPWVPETMNLVSKVILKRGYIITVAGRHGHLQSFDGKAAVRYAYKGFNKLIQGSGADLMKKAIVDMWEKGLTDIFPLYLTVHDEIVIGIPKTKTAIALLPEVQYIMEHTYPLSVPMRVDPEVGKDWMHVSGPGKKKNKKTGEVKVETMDRFLKRIAKEVKAV